jgi:hypothetical protein
MDSFWQHGIDHEEALATKIVSLGFPNPGFIFYGNIFP